MARRLSEAGSPAGPRASGRPGRPAKAATAPTPFVPERYDRVARGLHAAIGIALVGQIGFGLLLDAVVPRGTPWRGAAINLHKSIGIVLGLAVLLRLAWRLAHPPPGRPPGRSAARQRMVSLGHRALYACMLLMPTSGYLASNVSRHGVRFFGQRLAPWGPDLPGVYAALNTVHAATGWIFAGLIVGHGLIALQHGWVQRDGTLGRMSIRG